MAHIFLKRWGCKEYDLFLKNKGKIWCYFNFYKSESVHNHVVSNINNQNTSNDNHMNDYSKNLNLGFYNNSVNSYNNEKRKDLILHKSFSLLQNCNVKETIDILNIYIKLKNENIEFLKNICLNLLMNKEKIRHMEVLILLKKFSVIKCKDYYLFSYFKQILIDNMHVLNFEELVDIYFCYTNLNYFDYNFFFLIEKKIFYNFHKIDIKRLIMLIQCFNKKRIISRNYMTILLYSISKNMNNMNIFQLCVIFSFFKKFHINNTILISTLIHRFNCQVTINEGPKYISMFYNFLSYVKRKCVENYKILEGNKELLNMIENGNEIFINKEDFGSTHEEKILNNELNEENYRMNNVYDNSHKNLLLFSKELKEIENKYLPQFDELNKIREKTNYIKYNSYNMNILYTIQNTLKNMEMITRKHIKNMNVMSLCLLSSSLSHINKNKYMLEQIAESIGKNSTKLCPSLVSSFLLSYSKCGHKHGPLIYYSLDFFYKYYKFFDMNDTGLFCKALQLFCIKENEFIDTLNEYMINENNINNNISNIIYDNISSDNHDMISINNYYNNDKHGGKDIATNDNINILCYHIKKKLDNDMSKLNYEDSNDYFHKDLLNENNKEKKKTIENKNIINSYNKMKDHKYVNFSYIDYENIKKKNYYKNNLYNINNNIGSKYIYINNIVYILEYYAFLLVKNINILKDLCNIFINLELNYILYSRIFYAFYILQFNDNIIYKLIRKFTLHEPLYEGMYKEKHIFKIIEALKYYDDNKNENEINDIYFYILPKKTFSFIFNFSKYFLTYIFLRKNERFLKSYMYPIKSLPFYNDEYIYIHVSSNLFNKRL
ncbi:conserved Plasmodium protein, unknown function [Plasmodium sp. gorilla clade G3]|nr:conserved Plasmodium protein, unknown function [Plasmodium sp. gorilla clade G3]